MVCVAIHSDTVFLLAMDSGKMFIMETTDVTIDHK